MEIDNMGIEKECVMCGANFTTRSNKATSIYRCEACHSDKKQNRIMATYTKNLESQVVSLEDRVLRLESMLDTTVEIMVKAEVMSQLNHAPVVLDAVEKLKIDTEKKLMALNTRLVGMTGGHSFNKKKKKVKK